MLVSEIKSDEKNLVSGSWMLTVENPFCLGQVVLFNIYTRAIYKPVDNVKIYPSWGDMKARIAVLRWAIITGNQKNPLVKDFCKSLV